MERGRRRRRRRRRRPQHLLHPGERRQQALRPPRPPEVAQGPRAPACRSWSAAAWPRRTATSSSSGRRTSTSCSAPTTCAGPPSLLRAGRAATARSSRSSRRPIADDDAFPSALPVRRERAVRRPGSRSRSAATTRAPSASCPSVRGKEISRPFDEIVAEVEALAADGVVEVTLLGQNVNCYGRDLTRRAARCSPTCCGRSARSTASAGSATPARTPRTCGPRRSRPWPRRRRCASTCTCPLQSGSDRVAGRHAPRLHRRALPRAAGRGPRRRSPTWPSPPTSSSASPARPTTTSSAPSRSWPRPSTTAPTRSSSRPGPAPRRPSMADRFVPADVVAERFERLRVVVERSALARHQARGRAGRGGAGRGPEQARTRRRSPAAPGRTSSCTSRADGRCAAGTYADVRVTGAAPHHLRGELRRGHRPAPPPHPHPGGRSLSATARGTSRWSGRRRRASRRSPSRWPARARRRRARVGRLDAGVPGHGHRHGQADAGRAGRGAAPPARPGRPERGLHRRPVPGRGRRAPSPTSRRAATGPLLVGGTGLYLQAVVDGLDLPGRWPEVRAELEAEPDTAAPARPAGRARPGGRGAHGADQPAPGRAGPRGHPRQRPAVLVVRARPRRLPADAVRAGRRLRCRRAVLAERIARALRGAARRRASSTRCGPWPPPGRPVPHRRARPSATGSCSPTSPATCTARRGRRRWPSAAPAPFARRQRAWFRRDPRITLARRAGETRSLLLPALLGDWADAMHAPRPSTTAWATTSSSSSTSTARHPVDAGAGARPVRPPPGRRRRRPHPGDRRHATAPTSRWSCTTPTAVAAEMSGNGIRCLAQAVVDAGLVDGPEVAVATDAGRAGVAVGSDRRPAAQSASTWAPAKIERRGRRRRRRRSSTWATPTSCVDVDDPADARPRRARPAESPRPQRRVRRRRSRPRRAHHAGVTSGAWARPQACGTGACAAAVAAAHGWGLVGDTGHRAQAGRRRSRST